MVEADFEAGATSPNRFVWSRRDTLAVLGWWLTAVALKAPLVARIEGVLDHDQSVVALMAQDIATGRRFPIFFDGQRYMGAVEAYVAAGFVRLLGPGPSVVALAPLLFFGLYVAGQYAIWRLWQGRATGHIAALLAAVGSPMLALWGVIPRGGYIEVMAWALPTLAFYRAAVRPDAPDLRPFRQIGWGFLLALGYFLNPLSLVVYATIAVDWIFVRHGRELRGGFARGGALVGLGLVWVGVLALCVHVDPRSPGGSPYVFLGGWLPGRAGTLLGSFGAVALLGLAAWWTGAPARLFRVLTRYPAALLGVLVAWSPFLVYGALVRLGRVEAAPGLPVWIAAPWKSAGNLRSAWNVLGPILGCDPRAAETVLIGQGIEPPETAWPGFSGFLLALSPAVLSGAAALLALAAWRNRREMARAFVGDGNEPSPPAAFAFMYLGLSVALYLLQGTSPNASSVRYLVPVWVVVPGLLALGAQSLPKRPAAVAVGLLLAFWSAAQLTLYQSLDRPSPTRALARMLEQQKVCEIVAPTPVALVVAGLTESRVGALEYQAIWPRLGRRFQDRFQPGEPVWCMTDRNFPWSVRGEGAWAPGQDLERHLRGLSSRNPGRVRHVARVGSFDVWEATLGVDEVLAFEPEAADNVPAVLQAKASR